MSNICSQHRGHEPTCPRCNCTVEQFFSELGVDYKKMHEEAEAAGLHKCRCGFEYYKTTDSCPLCNRKR